MAWRNGHRRIKGAKIIVDAPHFNQHFFSCLFLVLIFGFFPLWAENSVRADLKFSLQSIEQIGLLSDAGGSSNAPEAFCGTFRASGVLSRSGVGDLPISVSSISLNWNDLNNAPSDPPCVIDPLSYKPYGIKEIDVYIATIDRDHTSVKKIVDMDSAEDVSASNFLRQKLSASTVSILKGGEVSSFDLIVTSRIDRPIEVWLEANFDQGGAAKVSTNKVVIWNQ